MVLLYVNTENGKMFVNHAAGNKFVRMANRNPSVKTAMVLPIVNTANTVPGAVIVGGRLFVATTDINTFAKIVTALVYASIINKNHTA